MRVSYAIIILCLGVYCSAQNLVPNPSFESYSNCPNASSQAYYAIPWVAPTNNDADYLNACSTTRGIPFNGAYPRTGNAMTGIHGYNGPGMNYREYLQAPLLFPLQAGKCYYVEYYVNLYRHIRAAINNMAAHLSTNPITSTGKGYVLNISSDILKFGNPIIKDTLNWTKIAGIFYPIGGESYITIGNFHDDAHTDTLDTHYGIPWDAYYFIDDVSVIPVDSLTMPAFAGHDTTIVQGDSIFLGQELYGLNCNWFDGNGQLIAISTSGLFVKPLSTTSYVVQQDLCGNISYDTVLVTVSPLGIALNNKKHIQVYPNPAQDNLIIQVSEQTIGKNFNIIDCMGRKMMTGKLKGTENSISISDLSAGTYFVTIEGSIKPVSFVKN